MKLTYKNLDAIPTKTLHQILSHPFTQGIDGADYEPVRHELEGIYYKRMNTLTEKIIKDYELQMKRDRKEQSRSHKTKRA